MSLRCPDIDLDKEQNRLAKEKKDLPNVDKDKDNNTFKSTGLSSGFTVIGVTTIDTTVGWDTADSKTQSTSEILSTSEIEFTSKMSTSDEPLTFTKTVSAPIDGNLPVQESEAVSIVMSTITREFTSTVTVDHSVELEPSTVWITSISPATDIPPPTTSDTTPSPVLPEYHRAVIYFMRRRRSSAPSGSRNNINVTVGNGECSRWSHSDDSRPTPMPASVHSQEDVVKTEVVKRPVRVLSPPPHYDDYWKGENDGYDMGVRETAGEASGSNYDQEQHYYDPKGKGKARDDTCI
ncbi:hypothetical protein FCULG_00002011 [Fusarium culmorum]|uniref:Uncharacterized protein n=1 Tax=Fusarium culmorum TaxID=5516 RepID=A0A2T4GPA2_FUSCU|nr:hypothetical protein FCULG_00002011 [Fusarium culmorum]